MPPLDFKVKQPGATLMVALSAAFPLGALAANAGLTIVSGMAVPTAAKIDPVTPSEIFRRSPR